MRLRLANVLFLFLVAIIVIASLTSGFLLMHKQHNGNREIDYAANEEPIGVGKKETSVDSVIKDMEETINSDANLHISFSRFLKKNVP